MNTDDNKIILDILNEQNEPVERKELWLMSGMDTEDFNNAVSYLEGKGEVILLIENLLIMVILNNIK